MKEGEIYTGGKAETGPPDVGKKGGSLSWTNYNSSSVSGPKHKKRKKKITGVRKGEVNPTHRERNVNPPKKKKGPSYRNEEEVELHNPTLHRKKVNV